jgi:UPF0042 nucleotide-binding protein
MSNTNDQAHVAIITGLSGAGRSQAANVFEDIGYFVVDNLPTDLIAELVRSVGAVEGSRSQVAVVADTRAGMNATNLDAALRELHRDGIRTSVLFLNADDRVLARRFEETRRPHPVEASSLQESIDAERNAFEDVRAMADVVIDTTDFNVHQLRDAVRSAFAHESEPASMRVDVMSFGFKRGMPRVADLMFDVRFLPNPHWIPELRPETGLDDSVRDYVFSHAEAAEFLDKVTGLLEFLIPLYEAEGKSYLTIAIGCTGGRHRSVALTEAIAARLAGRGVATVTHHRDLGR